MTGTDADPQGRSEQIAILGNAGVAVVETLEEATLLAVSLTQHQPQSESTAHNPLLDGVQVINAGLTQLRAGSTKQRYAGSALSVGARCRR